MTTAVDVGKPADKCGLESPGLVSDCRLMLSFARRNAFVLPLPLVHEIAWLDSVLRALDIATVSQMAPDLVWPIDLAKGQPHYTPSGPDRNAIDAAPALAAEAIGLSPEEVILEVHAKLSTLIAPTTALSLQTSEPLPGRQSIFGRLPPLVQYVIAIAFISAICFVISATQIASKQHTPAARQARDARAAGAIASAAPSQPSAPASADAASATNPGGDTPAVAPAAFRRAPAGARKASEGVKS